MNDFDQFLEVQLRHLLDPVVATRPPTRRGRSNGARKPILAIEAPIELGAEAIPLERAVVTIPVISAPQL